MKTRFFIAQPFAINKETYRPFVILVNDELREVINHYRGILFKDDNLSTLSIGHTVVDASVILLASEDSYLTSDYKDELSQIIKSVEPVNPNNEIENVINCSIFNEWMFAPELNWAENTMLILTASGFYFTCQTETDLIESSMFDYIDFSV